MDFKNLGPEFSQPVVMLAFNLSTLEADRQISEVEPSLVLSRTARDTQRNPVLRRKKKNTKNLGS